MCDNIKYEIADDHDIEQLVFMRIGYMEVDHGELSEADLEKMRHQLPIYFEKHLNKDIIAFVAKSNDKIIATALLLIVEKPSNPNFIHGKVGEVLNVYTLSDYQHRGIATKLMSQLIQYAKEQGIDCVDLSATDEGYEVYKRIGFEDKGEKYKEMRYVLTTKK